MNPTDKRFWLVVAVMLIPVIHTLFPYDDYDPDKTIDFFLFDDHKLMWKDYIYFHTEHIAIVLIMCLAYLETGRKIFKVWAVLEIIDTLDYAATFNSTWVTVPIPFADFSVGLDFNVFKFCALIPFAYREYGDSGSGYRFY